MNTCDLITGTDKIHQKRADHMGQTVGEQTGTLLLRNSVFRSVLPEHISSSNWTLDTIYPILDLLSYIRTETLLLPTCTE